MECDEDSLEQADKEKIHEKADESSSNSSIEQAVMEEILEDTDTSSLNGSPEQADDKEEILEKADKYCSSSSPEESDMEEMFETADKSFSSGSPDQSDSNENFANVDNFSFSGSFEQADDNEEFLENPDKYFSSGSPVQADKEEMLESADKSFSSGSPEQSDKEEMLESADKSFSSGSPEQSDMEEMLEGVDKSFSSGSPEQSEMEEMLEGADKSFSSGSPEQADSNEEMLPNADSVSFSGSPEQADDNEELLEHAEKSFSGSPEQGEDTEEILKNPVKSLPGGSPDQANNMEEIPENVDRSSRSVDLQKLSCHVKELDEASLRRSAQENSYRKPLSQENAPRRDEYEILHNVSRLDVGITSTGILQKHSVCSDKGEITVVTTSENMREVKENNCSNAVDSLLRMEEQVTGESVAECIQFVDTVERSLKTDKDIVALQSISESRQHATPSNTNDVQNSPGAYSVIIQENRQNFAMNNFSDAPESSLGTVKELVVNESVSESKQDLDKTASDGSGEEVMKRVVSELILENREDIDVSSCDVDYADSPIIDIEHIKLPILESKEDNSTTFISDAENLNTFETQVDRVPLLDSKQEHSTVDDQGSVPNTYEEKDSEIGKLKDSEIGKLENSECVQKVKKKYRKKPCAMNRGTQTAIQLLDSSEFRDYSLDLATMQVEVGFMAVDDLQDLDPSLDDWPVLLVSQLSLRDTIINTLNTKLLDLLSKGRRLEEDVDYLKLKIWDLKQQVKKKRQNKKEQCSQTTDEDFASAWKKWYCGTWHQYYGESDPSSVHYWPGHYSQHTTVSSLSQLKPTRDDEDSSIGIDGTILLEDEIQDNKEKTDEKEEDNGQISLDTQNCPNSTSEADMQEQRMDSKVDVIELGKQILKRQKSNQQELCKSQKDSECYGEGLIKKVEDKREYQTNTSSVNTSDKLIESGEKTEKITTKSHELGKLDNDNKNIHELENSRQKHQNTSDKSDITDVACRWDTSGVSISNQVKAVAAEAVQSTGYVFQEEVGLYYDYTSGYYYDAENGLYYDSKTGTYFYYDHASQAYQFHSQVSVKKERKRRLEKNGEDEKGTQQEKKKRLPKLKAVYAADKEEGECTDSDEEVQEKDELVVNNEEEEEIVSDLDEEAGFSEECDEKEEAAVHVPPSLRLMVVESESDNIKVGALHLITLDGGTVGRESRNVVQLLDLSISKVHAGIAYHSDGPEDHHYFVKDLGSNNGTFVNGVRLSEPRETSQEVEIGHGWMLQFGSITLKCHVHPGRLTCNECEPGLVISSLTSNKKSEGRSVASFKDAKSREKARKKQLKALRKKYAVTPRDEIPVKDGEYNDRALRRLKEVGSDNPYEKTEVASADIALRENNKGYTLLQKMGWSEGQGLGKSQSGITEPIRSESTVGHGGLGCTHLIAPPEPPQDRRRKHLQITQERYKQTSNNH